MTEPLATIAGVGLVTPIGSNARETWDALLAGRHIRDHAKIADAGEGPERFHTIAERVAREAMREAGWDCSADADVPLIVGTSKGPIEEWIVADKGERHASVPATREPDTNLIPFGLGDAAAELARRLHLVGPRMTLSAACASGLHALTRAVLMIASGQAERVLVVAAEASVHPMFVGSFRRLGVLPAEGELCRPFDQRRSGFLMSEAAAAVCLVSPAATRREDTSAVSIEHAGFAGDATHLTGSDPESRTLSRLLKNAIGGRPVELVHAHGTGTDLNDSAELAVIESVLAEIGIERQPSLFSHKGAIGHSLGASGLIGVVLNALMHRSGVILPNVNLNVPLPVSRVRLRRESVERSIVRSVVVASGFGGALGVVGLRSR